MWKKYKHTNRNKSKKFRNGIILTAFGALTVANFLLPEFGKEKILDIALADEYALPLYVAGYVLIILGLAIIGSGLKKH